jgi:hypothetical protein
MQDKCGMNHIGDVNNASNTSYTVISFLIGEIVTALVEPDHKNEKQKR